MNPAYFTHIGKKILAILLLLAVGAAGAAGAVRGSKPGEKVRPREEAASAEAVSFLTDVEQGRLAAGLRLPPLSAPKKRRKIWGPAPKCSCLSIR